LDKTLLTHNLQLN